MVCRGLRPDRVEHRGAAHGELRTRTESALLLGMPAPQSQPDAQPQPQPVIVSYLTLRRVVGILGVALPVVLAVWGFFILHAVEVLPTISDYYRLRTRDAFVGTLFTIAWFLFTYRGYDRRDDVAGDLACAFALGVALFPASGSPVERAIHFACAAAMFLALAYFSLFLFTKTKTSGSPTRMKLVRNKVYRACGAAILACIALIALYENALADTALARLDPVFWLESLALWAFGISWFVKGETILTDA